MHKKEYNWKRFLVPLGEDVKLDYEGYLYDPEDEWGRHYNENIISFDKIENEPCLIIIGEPRIGKTTTLRNECKRLGESGKKVLWVDLKDISSDYSLDEDIFRTKYGRARQSFG